MAFKEFTEFYSKKTYAQRGVVGIRKSGHVFFPEKLLEEHGFSGGKYTVIYIDEAEKKIGFKLLKDKPKNSIYKTLYQETSGCSLNIRGVLEHFKMFPIVGSDRKVSVDKNMLVVEL